MRAHWPRLLGPVAVLGLARVGWAEPVSVPLEDVVDLSVGDSHACAVTADGLVHCWGDGRDHRLGNGLELSSRVPLQVPGLRGVARVAAGGHVTCALRAEGEVLCWGGLARRAGRGGDELERGDFEPVVSPRVVATALAGTVDLSVGRHQVVLVDRAGDVSVLTSYVGPIPLPGFRSIRRVASFSEGFCGVAGDGRLFCLTSSESVAWDGGAEGGYGEEPSAVLRPFAEVPVEARDVYAGVCAGEEAPGWCREHARLADGSAGRPGASSPKAFDVHGALACMLVDSAGGGPRLGCFGCADCHGAEAPPLGLGPEPVAVPVLIAAAKGLPRMSEVAVGERHVCVMADGVHCWGDGAEGQLGSSPVSFEPARPTFDGAQFPVLTAKVGSAAPLAVEGLGEVVRIEAGDATTCALRRDRRVVCWGHVLGTPRGSRLQQGERPDATSGGGPHTRPMPILAANARTAPPGRLCREVDVFARDRLEERRYGYDAKGRLVRVEHREGPTSELVAEERHRLSRAGHIVRTDRREWLGERWHGTSTRFRRDRAGRVVWSKARGSINDAAQVFRYDRQGRLIEERDGALRKTIRQAAWPASGGDPIGLPFPSAWPAEAVITEALEESRWDEARHLEVTSNGTLLYERKVTHGEVVATGYTVGPDGVEVISERHFELSFYESPLRRVETRTIPAGASGEPALVERWEALGPGEPTLTRRTARLETGCLE